MKIRKFNESWKKLSASWQEAPMIYCVVEHDENFNGNHYKRLQCFSSEMMAADYLIKYINYFHNQKFEPYFDEDGNRFFSNVDENDDYGICCSYCDELQLGISVVEGAYHTQPKVIKEI